MTKTEQTALVKVYCDTHCKIIESVEQTVKYRETLNTIAEDLMGTAEERTYIIPDGSGNYLLLFWDSDRCYHHQPEIINTGDV